MNIDKNKILDLFNLEDFQAIKAEIEKVELKNKDNLLNVLNAVLITDSDLTSYNGLMQKYNGSDIAQEIEKTKLKQLSALRSEIEKL